MPEWFGNKQAVEEYVEEVKNTSYYASLNSAGKCVGFFSANIHYDHTGDIYVCGVLPEYQHSGV